MFTANIYGTSNMNRPDIVYRFDIASSMNNGKWSYSTCSTSYEFHNELIDELEEKNVINEIDRTITDILNSEKGHSWISSPRLRLYYDNVEKKQVVRY